MTEEVPQTVDSLVGVYDADGSLAGELAYVVGKALGRRHCALCDITHGTFRRRPEFDECAAGLGVPFELVHLDERADDVRAASDGHVPCVLARTGGDLVRLVDRSGLERCGKDPARLAAAVRTAAGERGLTLPG